MRRGSAFSRWVAAGGGVPKQLPSVDSAASCSSPDGPSSRRAVGDGTPTTHAPLTEKVEVEVWHSRCYFASSDQVLKQIEEDLEGLGYKTDRSPLGLYFDFQPKGGTFTRLAAALLLLLHSGLRLTAPAALADEVAIVGGRGLQAALKAKLNTWLCLAFLPRVPAPVPQGGATAAGVLVLWLCQDGFVQGVNAPQPLLAEVQQCMPWIDPSEWQWLQRVLKGRFSVAALLAVVLPVMERLGFELVAPYGVVEWDGVAGGTSPRVRAKTERAARDANDGKLPLVFFPRAEEASPRSPQDLAEGPSGDIELKLHASGGEDSDGVAVIAEAPPGARHALEEARPWLSEESSALLRGVSAKFAPGVHEAVVSRIQRLGYEPVPSEATRPLYFRSSLARREEERRVQAESEAAPRVEAEAAIPHSDEQQQTLRAELAEARSALDEERASRRAVEAKPEALELQLAAFRWTAWNQQRAARKALEAKQQVLRAKLARAESALEEERAARAAQEADCMEHEAARRAHSEQAARLAEEQQALRAELEEASSAREADCMEHEAARRAQAERAARLAEEQWALRAELAEASSALEACSAARDAALCAQAEQADEQRRALRAELEEASIAEKAEQERHQSATAEAEQAAREAEAPDASREHSAQRLEACRWHWASHGASEESGGKAAQPGHKAVTKPSRAQRAPDEQLGAMLPSIRVQDVSSGTAGTTKHVRVDCPGALEIDVSIEGAGGNGVHLRIEARAGVKARVVLLRFDRPQESSAELGPDDFNYEDGVLTLALRQMSPKRVKLKLASPSPSAPATQDVQSGGRRCSTAAPVHYDIASQADGSDCESTEVGSWEVDEVDEVERTAEAKGELDDFAPTS